MFNIAQRLVGPSRELKQIFQIEHNIVKNANCGFDLRGTVEQIQVVVRARLEPVTAEL